MNKIVAVVDTVKEPETFQTKKGTDFTKQEVILSVEGKYPNFIPIEMSGETVGKISSSDAGRKVEVGFFLNGRKGTGKFEGRCFVSLRYAEHSFIDGEPGNEPEPEPEGENFDF